MSEFIRYSGREPDPEMGFGLGYGIDLYFPETDHSISGVLLEGIVTREEALFIAEEIADSSSPDLDFEIDIYPIDPHDTEDPMQLFGMWNP